VLGGEWQRLVDAYRPHMVNEQAPSMDYFGDAEQERLLDIAPDLRTELESLVGQLQQQHRYRLAVRPLAPHPPVGNLHRQGWLFGG
jgi:hypothetical protein